MKNPVVYVLPIALGFTLGVAAKIGFDRIYATKPRVLTFERVFHGDPPPPPYLEDADIAASISAESEVESEIRKRFDVRPGANLHVIISPRLGGYKAQVELPEGVALSQRDFESLVADAKATGFRQWARSVIEFEKKKEGIPPISADKLKKVFEKEPNQSPQPTAPSGRG